MRNREGRAVQTLQYSSLEDPTSRLNGCRVVITGAAGGVGRCVATSMARAGARLLLGDRSGSDFTSLNLPSEQHVFEGDLANGEAVAALYARADELLGGVDLLVACAGVGSRPLTEMAESEWRYVLDSNLASYVACTQRAVERMRASGRGGAVILVGSISVHIKAVGESVYNAAKGGVASFAETLRKELMHDAIRVTLIEPGAIASAMQPFTPAEREQMVAEHRLLRPEAVADAIMFAAAQPPGVDIVTLRIEPQIQKIC